MIGLPADQQDISFLAGVGGVSAIVVNYNAGDLLLGCVSSLVAAGAAEVIIVDNASADTSVADCVAGVKPSESQVVKVLQTGANLGYGRAANLGAAEAHSNYLVICNPDCEIESSALTTLVRFLRENPSAGIVGPKILDEAGGVYPSPRRFPSLTTSAFHALLGQLRPNNRFSSHYKSSDAQELGSDHWVSGAFIMIERSFFTAVGGFDADFFMFMEDVELSRRVIDGGRQVGFVADARVVHRQGHSSRSRPYLVIWAHHRSLWVYAKKTTRGARRALLPVIAMGIGVRFSISAVRAALGSGSGSHNR